MKKRYVIGVGATCLLVALAATSLIDPDQPVKSPVKEGQIEPVPKSRSMRVNLRVPDESEEYRSEPGELEGLEEALRYQDSLLAPDHPRALWVEDFRSGELPPGYALHGARLTERGFELEPAESGEKGQIRIGMVESPALELDFPSNTVGMAWLANLPEGTSALVEISVSPDGKNWDMWHATGVEHDTHSLYPEGSATPEIGQTPGRLFMTWGDQLWSHWRYRISLYAEEGESPVISSIENAYQDTTGREGRAGEIKGPAEADRYEGKPSAP